MFKQLASVLLCVLFCTTLHSEEIKKKPVVYLTFDDGPSGDQVTEQILEVLAMYQAKATFFVTGARARANPEKILKILDAGHALGNHTHNHSSLTTLANQDVEQELSNTNHYVLSAGGHNMTCFRPPFGSTNARVNLVALSLGLRKVGWTIDTRDWDAFSDSEQIALQLGDSQNGSIVLMHDGPASRWRTLEVFTRWMEDSAGAYQFEALPECLPRAPATQSFASLDAAEAAFVQEPVTALAAVDAAPLTVAMLLDKLSSYDFELAPEVVAQQSNKEFYQY